MLTGGFQPRNGALRCAHAFARTGLGKKRSVIMENGFVLRPPNMGKPSTQLLCAGFATEREFNDARKVLLALDMVVLGGSDVAVEAAKNHRKLRGIGVTVRKAIDTLIATRCIVSGHMLLHSDRDFDAFEQHLGLRCVTSGTFG